MQYYFSLLPEALEAFEKALSSARLARYLGAAKGDRNRAVRLYIWNVDLSREFYLPIQLTEVALRNSIHNHLTALYGNLWFEARGLISAVPERTRVEVTKVVSLERFHAALPLPSITLSRVIRLLAVAPERFYDRALMVGKHSLYFSPPAVDAAPARRSQAIRKAETVS